MGEVLDEVRIDGIIVREVLNAPGDLLDDHSHDGATLGILLEGEVTERRGDGSVGIQRPGDVFVRRPGVRHGNQYSPVAGTRSLYLEVDYDDPRAVLVSRADALHRDELRCEAERFVRTFRRGRGAPLRGAFEALLSGATSLRVRAAPAWLSAARETLAYRFDCPPRISDLAQTLGVHPVHFTQVFRARFGLTPGEFVRAHKVFSAIALAAKGVPLAEVAATCGFADQSHMTRAIRAIRGMPPARLMGLTKRLG